MGNSTTLPIDLINIDDIERVLLKLTEQVMYRLRKYNLLATVVNVQLRTNEFKDFSHQSKLDWPTSNTKDVFEKVKLLLREMYKEENPIRLVGIRVDKLIRKGEMQLSLFDNLENKKQEKIEMVVDELKQKYGYNTITRGGEINNNQKL